MIPALFFAIGLLASPTVSTPQTGRDLSERFELPEGLALTLFAESPQLFNPTCMDVDARGRVWVAEAVNYRTWGGRNPGRRHPEGDRIVILEDSDGDGVADSSKVFIQDKDLVAPLGLAVIGDSVYVSSSPNLFRYVDADGDDIPERRETFLTGFGGFDHDHGLHSVVAGPDGRLWFNVGNAGPHLVTGSDGWHLRSGSLYNGGGPAQVDNKPGLVSDDGRAWTGGLVLSVNPDGSDLRVHAHNFRNIYEVALDSFGNFFEADNDDDGNRSCRSLWCLEFANHGYFSADGTRYWRADKRPTQSIQAAHWHQDDPGVAPAGTITGAGGPTGIAILEGSLLGDSLEGVLLNCDAGAGVVYAHRPVARGAGVELQPGELLRPRADLEDRGARWFRPSDVVVGVAGEIYVSDWYDPGVGGHAAGDREAYGRILRIAPKGITLERPDFDDRTLGGALELLASPAPNVRELGRRALIKNLVRDPGIHVGMEVQRALFERVLRERGERVAARLFGLFEGTLARHVVESEFEGPPALVEAALRSLRRGVGLGLDLIREQGLARNPSLAVRREVALALRGIALEECLDVLLDLAEGFDGTDRTYLEAFGLAAEGKEEALWAELAAELGDSPLAWDARFEGLAWRLHPAGALDAHVARAMSTTLPVAARRRALDALAFTPGRAAGEAMLTLALSGPEDLRGYARWWVDFRSDNVWRDYGLSRQLGSADREGAELAWESGVVRSGSVPFEVDVTGAETVWLVATDGGDGNSCDWADWVTPRFDTPEGPIELTRLGWISAETEWGTVAVDRNVAGGALRIGEREVRGIGTHAASSIAFAVPAEATRLFGQAGPDLGGTSQGDRTSIRFQVWVKFPPAALPIQEWTATLLDPRADPDRRLEVADALARDGSGALRLIALARAHRLPDEVLPVITRAIHRNPDIGVRALASEVFPPPGARKEYPSLAELASLVGNPENGRRIFRDRNRAQCSTCHVMRMGDTPLGGDIGPELTRIREKYDVTALLDAILNPSAGISFGYDTWLIETEDGLLYNGFILADGLDLVLKDTQGLRHVIPADSIVSRTKETLSTMPEGVALGLAPQELADLAAFLLEDPDAERKYGETIALFNGQDLSGWTHHLSQPNVDPAEVWSVTDGVLRCEGQPIGYLRTEEGFKNFLLELEWRFDPERGPGNSGVLLRMVGSDKVWPRSIEAQLQSGNAGDFWNIDKFGMLPAAERTSGRHTTRMQPSSEKPLGEWNRYEILVDGPRVELRVNGVLQNTADWCEEVPGKICLQSEGATIEFRNIHLTPILR